HLSLAVEALRQPENVAVPRDRPRHVARRHRHEIDLFDLHQSLGAYRRWGISSLPAGAVKKAQWQTPLSKGSPRNSTPCDPSSFLASSTSGTRSAIEDVCGPLNCCPMFVGSSR